MEMSASSADSVPVATNPGVWLGAVMGERWGEDDPRLMNVLDGFQALLRSQAEPGEAEKVVTRMERIRVRQAIANDRKQAAPAS